MTARDLDLLSLERRVEALLSPFAAAGSPGCTIGVVRGGALLLHRSAGLAQIEHGVPVGPGTRFRIASVSKQFTCAAALMLAQQGRLALDAPITDFFPELARLGAPITIDQLMQNVSGIRDMLELMRLGGLDLGGACGADDLYAAIARQRGLNFAPGSRFLYSNSGFFLLGRIVEHVTGRPLGEVLEQRIFAPLGMTRTRFTPSVAELVPDLAAGYLPAEGRFIRAAHGFALGGEGGLVSCAEDLALWARNAETGRVGGAALMRALGEGAPFTNGQPNAYRRGLETDRLRGIDTIGHGGLWPGYKTAFLRAPAEGLAVIVITNHGGADPGRLAAQVLEAALPGMAPEAPMPPRHMLDAMAGRWIGETASLDLSIDEAGRPMMRSHGVPFALHPRADGWLEARRGAFPFSLRAVPDGLEVEFDAGMRVPFRRAPAESAPPAALPGRYACAELAAEWEIDAAHRVTARGPHATAGPWRIEAVSPALLRLHVPGVLFEGWYDIRPRGDGALEVFGARARGLVFTRRG